MASRASRYVQRVHSKTRITSVWIFHPVMRYQKVILSCCDVFVGQCRPGCENLPRDVSINTNYGRVNGFLVYLYDGPRVPEFDRPGVANVDKVKGKVSVFLGIPYAQPPTGNARLMVRT